MKPLHLAYAVAVFCLTSNAMASNWQRIPHVDQGPDFSRYDKQTLKRRGNVVEFWLEASWFQPRQASDNAYYNQVQSQWQIDCDSDTFASRAFTYSLNGAMVERTPGQYWVQPIPPDTWAQAVETVVCKR